MTRKQLNNVLLCARRNWAKGRHTALYRDGDMIRVQGVDNPMLADEQDLIGVVDGEIDMDWLREIVT